MDKSASPGEIERLDPITAEIIQNSLTAICDEMFVAMQKTAMSTAIYELLDYGTALTDAEGYAATVGVGIPFFIASIDYGVQGVLKRFGKDAIRPGDVFLTNDPFGAGASHLNDITVMMPVFAGSELVAWTANKSHWSDIGGMTPGSMPLNATEIYQEGLQLPLLRIIDGGKPDQAIFDIIASNSRIPDYTLGDLWAGIASARVGERRVLDLVQRYSVRAVKSAIKAYIDYGERVARAELKRLPKGVFEAEDFDEEVDGDKIRVKVTITDDEFIVDFRGNPPQRRKAVNNTHAFTELMTKVLYKAIVNPTLVCNAGVFRPLKVITEPGTIFGAVHPAPVSWHAQPLNYGSDLIWKALAPVMPLRLPAGHYGSACGLFISSAHPDTGHYHTSVEPHPGGWGASSTRDGENGQFCVINGETYTVPAEVNEARNGFIVEQCGFHNKDGGEGEFRGGRGIHIVYRIRSEDAIVTAVMTPRYHTRPWGLNEGNPGCTNELILERTDGTRSCSNLVSGEVLHKGDRIHILSGHGGGNGNPLRRRHDLIVSDLEDGYVTEDQAQRHYGYPSKAIG